MDFPQILGRWLGWIFRLGLRSIFSLFPYIEKSRREVFGRTWSSVVAEVPRGVRPGRTCSGGAGVDRRLTELVGPLLEVQ